MGNTELPVTRGMKAVEIKQPLSANKCIIYHKLILLSPFSPRQQDWVAWEAKETC